MRKKIISILLLTILSASLPSEMFAQSEYIEAGESAFGVIGFRNGEPEGIPGVAVGASFERKIDISASYSWKSGRKIYGYKTSGFGIGTANIILFPLEIFKPDYPIALGLSGGVSASTGGSSIPVYSVGIILYKHLNIDKVMSFTPEISIIRSMQKINHINYSTTSLIYGCSVGFNLFNDSFKGTKFNRFMIIAFEFAAGEVEDEMVYSVGVGLIIRLWDADKKTDAGYDFN